MVNTFGLTRLAIVVSDLYVIELSHEEETSARGFR
jgi:hypothetical protein